MGSVIPAPLQLLQRRPKGYAVGNPSPLQRCPGGYGLCPSGPAIRPHGALRATPFATAAILPIQAEIALNQSELVLIC